ncbi:hypothetical protein LJC19_08195, partial [Oxalobacter sp. OttesenSCG-928-P03]|nr:hypothetical protein [Oxalobacter sp. OttesenSCG-928-P03]
FSAAGFLVFRLVTLGFHLLSFSSTNISLADLCDNRNAYLLLLYNNNDFSAKYSNIINISMRCVMFIA